MQIAALAILGLVLVVVGFIFQFVLPDIKFIGWGMIALGTILSVSSFILEFRRVRKALTSHRGKFSASNTILISAFMGIILLVNAAAANVYKGFDLTGISQFTVTQQTKDVLKNVDMPIDVICFFVPTVKNVDASLTDYFTTARQYAPALLAEYSNYTHLLNIKVYDPEERPELAREYGLVSEYYYQSVVFETSLGRVFVSAVQIYAEGENAFTSAILQVTGAKMKTVYFLSGHGEVDPVDGSDVGYADARKELRNNLYEVKTLDLLASGSVPADCTVLVVAGPKTTMAEAERNAIIAYLDNAGQAVFLTNPNSPDDIAQIGALWGFDVKNGTIIDPTNYAAPNKDTPSFNRTTNYFQFTSLYFPGLTVVDLQQQIPQGMEPIPMLLTSKDAWMTDNYNPNTELKFDASKGDINAPDTGLLGGVILRPGIPTDATQSAVNGPSIAIIGDSDFATNKNFYNGNNGEFFLRLVNQFASGTEVVSIQSKVLQPRKLILTPEKSRFLSISSIALLPGLVLLFGFIVWWRGR